MVDQKFVPQLSEYDDVIRWLLFRLASGPPTLSSPLPIVERLINVLGGKETPHLLQANLTLIPLQLVDSLGVVCQHRHVEELVAGAVYTRSKPMLVGSAEYKLLPKCFLCLCVTATLAFIQRGPKTFSRN